MSTALMPSFYLECKVWKIFLGKRYTGAYDKYRQTKNGKTR
jgi:hypothetical protein